jgi:protein TonB
MVGLSAALHGLLLISVPGRVSLPPSTPEEPFVSTLKMIKVGSRPPKKVQDSPAVVEEAPDPFIEPSPKPQPEIPMAQEAVQETVNHAEALGNNRTEKGQNEDALWSSNDIGNNEGLTESGAAKDREKREYDALLAYIKEFINKNLVYPPMARRRNIEGIAGVSFMIDNNGGLSAVTVDHSSGSAILDNAALSLIKKMPLSKNVRLNRTLILNVNIEYKLTE